MIVLGFSWHGSAFACVSRSIGLKKCTKVALRVTTKQTAGRWPNLTADYAHPKCASARSLLIAAIFHPVFPEGGSRGIFVSLLPFCVSSPRCQTAAMKG